MAKFLVAFSVDAYEDLTEDQLREMLNDNCFQHIDGAPFGMSRLLVKDVSENFDGLQVKLQMWLEQSQERMIEYGKDKNTYGRLFTITWQ